VSSVIFSVPVLIVTAPVKVLDDDDDGDNVSVLVEDVFFVMLPVPEMALVSVWLADDE
jgi:hypothetical protein